MALLVDFNNISAATVIASVNAPGQQKMSADDVLDETFIRHVLISSILSYRMRYPNHGKIILCRDAANSWRKSVYPYYKIRRSTKNQVQQINWDEFHKLINLIVDEFKENMPFTIVKAANAEGDDCIAVLAEKLSQEEDVVVISNDKDFRQLLRIPNLKLYRPIKNEEVNILDPAAQLKEMIIRGDDGDDIPNIFSDDDVFVVKEKRQKSIQSKKLSYYMENDFSVYAEEDKIKRNVTMIDLRAIPNEISERILEAFSQASSQKSANRQQILRYFGEKRLRRHIENIEHF